MQHPFNVSVHFLPRSGDMAILLLRGDPGLSLSEGRYLFLLPLSPCCYDESSCFTSKRKEWGKKKKNQWDNEKCNI